MHHDNESLLLRQHLLHILDLPRQKRQHLIPLLSNHHVVLQPNPAHILVLLNLLPVQVLAFDRIAETFLQFKIDEVTTWLNGDAHALFELPSRP